MIVERFIKKLENLELKYIFAVCTYGGFGPVNALPTLKNLAKLIQSMGGKLSGEFSIRLPLNNLDYGHIPVPVNRNHEVIFQNSQYQIEDICKRINSRKNTKYKILKSLLNFLLTPMYSMMYKVIVKSLKTTAKVPDDSNMSFRELIPLTDKSIYVNDKCNGCGACAKVCPVQNIKIIENKPVWQHHCEMCLACDEWCPQKAIHHWCKFEGKDYHHPDVKIADMLRQNMKISYLSSIFFVFNYKIVR
jgi:formate hydrogenlyase subunit 6/NADH:ubiquinone oxidoreductase subunit I